MWTQHPVVKQIFIAAPARLVGSGRECAGRILASVTPFSLWGGVDPATGNIIDHHHPLNDKNWDDRALVIPHGRGSCTGSAVLLEAIHAGHAPALILLNHADPIIGLGAIVAAEVLQQSPPVVVLDDAAFAMALQANEASLSPDGVLTLRGGHVLDTIAVTARTRTPPRPQLQLSKRDKQRLAGDDGRAVQTAMRIICRMAELQDAPRLIDVSQGHIDGCIYTGPAGLAFAQQLADWQGQVAVPTTLNSISIDRRRWRMLDVPEQQAQPAEALAEAYVRLGARPTYTCTPYLLDKPPREGECIAWAESNAVVFANSVLGAKTGKTPDLMDACVALTGRVPLAGYYLDAQRRARVVVELPDIKAADDALYPLLGHVIGNRTDPHVPVITGLEQGWTTAALKAFGAAFATTSSAGMFHIAGVTPEAPTPEAVLVQDESMACLQLTHADLQAAWQELNNMGPDQAELWVELVALGNPHFSRSEFAALAALCEGRCKQAAVDMVVTTSRHVCEQAEAAGHLAVVRRFGARVLTDTCWCMLRAPIIGPTTRTIVTNSAKYAHYGPGLTGQSVRFASLQVCVDAAVSGWLPVGLPTWLANAGKSANG